MQCRHSGACLFKQTAFVESAVADELMAAMFQPAQIRGKISSSCSGASRPCQLSTAKAVHTTTACSICWQQSSETLLSGLG